MVLRTVAYRNLAAQIRTAIRNGEYADGRQLPTEEQLAASYSVSRQTVRRAMQDLVSEGIIYRVAGRVPTRSPRKTGTSIISAPWRS